MTRDIDRGIRRIDPATLGKWAVRVFMRAGLPAPDAKTIADCLLYSEIRGRRSHGFLRMGYWLNRLRAGGTNPHPRIRLLRQTRISAVMDLDSAAGPVGGRKVIETAIAKAQVSGMAWIAARNGNHLGAMGYYTALAQKRGMIGVAFSNAAPSMPAPGGKSPLLGNNPFSVALPSKDSPGFMLDVSTSLMNWGDVDALRLLGGLLPHGCFLDQGGRGTRHPARAEMVVPAAGHKGFGIAFAIGLLTSILSGGPFDRQLTHPAKAPASPGRYSFLMGAIRPDLYCSPREFKRRLELILTAVNRSVSGKSGIRSPVPGRGGASQAKKNLRIGLPIPLPFLRNLARIGRQWGVAFPY